MDDDLDENAQDGQQDEEEPRNEIEENLEGEEGHQAIDLPDPWENHPSPLPNVVSTSLPPIMGQEDPLRMKLLLNEWEQAWNIKGILATDPEVDMVSDFLIAQVALISMAAPVPEEDALRRVVGLQAFRERHGIRDTLQDGCRAIQELVELLPGYLLYLGFQPEEGGYVGVGEVAQLDTSNLTTEANFKKFMVGYYYVLHAVTCDLESVRKGAVTVVDCGGVNWSKKNDFKVLKELFDQLFSIYPLQYSTQQYNTGVIYNMLFSMAKKALPKELADRHVCGYTSDGPLRDVFMVPTVEAGTRRLVAQYERALGRRYGHEIGFSLH